jgi:hypothetical protein
MRKPFPPCNLVQLAKPNRSKAHAGDLFVLNHLGKRWIAGRVVHTDAQFVSDGGDEPLCYFYNIDVKEPAEITPPLKPDLLIGPQVTNYMGWQRGYFVTIGNYPIIPEERLPRHCFRGLTSTPKAWGDPSQPYQNEFRNRVSTPERSEYESIGHVSYRIIDDRLSDALGELRAPLIGDDYRPASSELAKHAAIAAIFSCSPEMLAQLRRALDRHASHAARVEEESDQELETVSLHAPAPDARSVKILITLSEKIDRHLKKHRVGTKEGHGTDLVTGVMDFRFEGGSAERIISAIMPLLRQTRLPRGSYLMIQTRDPGDAGTRIDLGP